MKFRYFRVFCLELPAGHPGAWAFVLDLSFRLNFIPGGGILPYITGVGIMKQCMEPGKLHLRLRKVIGQLNAVEKMIDKDVPCEDILIQINAAKSALHKIGQIVLEGHLKHCVRYGIEHGDAENTLSDFSKALEHFSRMS